MPGEAVPSTHRTLTQPLGTVLGLPLSAVGETLISSIAAVGNKEGISVNGIRLACCTKSKEQRTGMEAMEFVDTNIFIYAHDPNAGPKREKARELIARLVEAGDGAISTQVLSEFYSIATRKLSMSRQVAEAIVSDLHVWTLHRPTHADIMAAIQLQHRYAISWWDALIVNSTIELGCRTLWSEDLSHGQQYGSAMVRNPFV